MTQTTKGNGADKRRYDIDWLRSLAFILLIFYHIGQFYVTGWDWHVKSEYQSDILKNFMLLVNQWRMPLIFLISGIALSLVEHKVGIWRLFKIRFVRVLIPLVFGMYLIVPPQLYYQLIQNYGFTGNYFEFFRFYVDTGTTLYPEQQHAPIGLITWNHLWYLPYLFSYTLVYMLIKPLLSRVNWQRFMLNVSPWTIFLFPVSLLTFYNMVLEPLFPRTHALVDDWYSHAYFFTTFMFGYVLAKSTAVWEKVIEMRKVWLILAVISYVLMIIRFNRAFGFDINYGDAPLAIQTLIIFIYRANTILGLLVVIGFAGVYLNKKSKILSYMNEAVLPWYILHQSVIIVVAMNLAKFSLGAVVEPILVILLTFIICLIGFELIKRNDITRFIFGMKLAKLG